MISGSNQQLQEQLELHPTKAWLSQVVNFTNALWALEERYAIKLCFKLGKKYHAMKAGSTAMIQ